MAMHLTQGRWRTVAPFPEPKEELFGVAASGHIYVFGGIIPRWKPASAVHAYDPGANQWVQKQPMPLPAHHIALAESNGKIYIFGGFVCPPSGPVGWAPIANSWLYDPSTDAWTELAPMPTARGAAAAVAVGSTIYVVGGATIASGAKEPFLNLTTPQNVLATVEAYDPETNAWKETASMPTPRNHVAIGAVDAKIYVIGGRVGAPFVGQISSNVSLVEVYDTTSGSWGPQRTRMPTARSGMGFATHRGRIYVAGGEFQDATMTATFRSFESYDPKTDTWLVLPPMRVARHGLAAAVVGDRFYAVGGDVQSAATGVAVSSALVDAFEFPVD